MAQDENSIIDTISVAAMIAAQQADIDRYEEAERRNAIACAISEGDLIEWGKMQRELDSAFGACVTDIDAALECVTNNV